MSIPPLDLVPGLAALAAMDADLAGLIAAQSAPPSRQRPQGFVTLAQAIVGQQVSTASAAAIWRRLEAGVRPFAPEGIARLDENALRAFGLSRPKVRYLRALAGAVADGTLDFEAVARMDDETAIAALSALPGIGRWTAEIYLLSALQRPDVFPAADIALLSAIADIKGLEARPTPKQGAAIAQSWSPWRAVAARLLWQHYRAMKGIDTGL